MPRLLVLEPELVICQQLYNRHFQHQRRVPPPGTNTHGSAQPTTTTSPSQDSSPRGKRPLLTRPVTPVLKSASPSRRRLNTCRACPRLLLALRSSFVRTACRRNHAEKGIWPCCARYRKRRRRQYRPPREGPPFEKVKGSRALRRMPTVADEVRI